tara:strand:+ start:1187 stop:2821 length:1635 start_codon:yes stop_codon:yes gene_type:complete
MKKFLFLFILLLFSNNVLAESKWITKKNSKTSKVKTLEQMYADGLLTRSECIKAKKKILKNQSIPGCKKTETEDESTVTYITKKKKDLSFCVIKSTGSTSWNAANFYLMKDESICSDMVVDQNHKSFEKLKKVYGNTKKGEVKTLDREKYNFIFEKETLIAKKKPKIKKATPEKKVEKYIPEDMLEDNIKPKIQITSKTTFKDPDYVLTGKVTDKGGSEKFYLFSQKGEGKKVRVKLNNGNFNIERFSYDNEEIKLIAIDEYRNETTKVVKVKINIEEETEIAKFYDKPKPLIKGKKNNNRVAIIIGVENYENTVQALYANNDAEIFKNFAIRSLGISSSNIKVLIGDEAERNDILKVFKKWLPKKIITNQSELFVFFSGHGYPSENEGLHLIPQDGDPTMLEDTSLSHKLIIDVIQKNNPKSVTMFIDACYSGQSNTGEVLVAGLKPLRKIITEDVPNNFTIFSSSESNGTSGTIKEAEHGIFSYYLMKGLSGEADIDKDRKITNQELFVYLQDNVSQEAFTQNREQNPKLNSHKQEQIIMRY